MHIILIHSDVEEPELLEQSLNENTFIYNNELLHDNITHLALIYHTQPVIPFFSGSSTQFNFFTQGFIDFIQSLPNLEYIDLLTCRIEDSILINEIQQFETLYNITIRFSMDDTGNDTNWILESHNVNVKYLYFTSKIEEWNYILSPLNFNIGMGYYASSPFTLIYDGDTPTGNIQREVMYTDRYGKPLNVLYDASFNNIRHSNIETIITWGLSTHGANSTNVNKSNIVSILPSLYAYGAIKSDNSVVAWGHAEYGGNLTISITNVKSLYSTYSAFAALHYTGGVTTWGPSTGGGNSSAVQAQLYNISMIFSTSYAFAALRNDGAVITWGDSAFGGTSSNITNVATITSNYGAFTALRRNGTVFSWGSTTYGASSSLTSITNVKSVCSTNQAFAGLHNNGTVTTWGHQTFGGNSSSVQSQLYNITSIYGSRYTFTAIRSDGQFIIWGVDTNVVYNPNNSIAVTLSYQAFASIKSDGTIGLWGSSAHGAVTTSATSARAIFANANSFIVLTTSNSLIPIGSITGTPSINNAISVQSTLDAYSVIRSDGTVLSWGNQTNGGNSSSLSFSNISHLYASYVSFVALKSFDLPVSNIIQTSVPEISNNTAIFTNPPNIPLSDNPREQSRNIATELLNMTNASIVKASSDFFPVSIPRDFVRIVNQPVFNTNTLEMNEALYLITQPTVNIYYNTNDYLTFNYYDTYYDIIKSTDPSQTLTYNVGDTFTFQNVTYVLGSIIAYISVRPINFVLTHLNKTVGMDICGSLLSSSIELSDADCISIMDISLSDALSVFKFQTDASDIDPDNTGNDITYYIDSSVFPYLNIANSSVHISDIEPRIISLSLPDYLTPWGSFGYFERTRSLLKHDYIRYLAHKLFNTYHAADLFSNEGELKNEIFNQGDIVHQSILYDLSSANLLTNADTSSIGYNILKQIGEFNPERFQNIEPSTSPQSIPFYNNDTLIFNVTINPAENQHLLTNTTIIPPRTYRIIFRITDTPNNVTPTD
jgi:hypothetical protein